MVKAFLTAYQSYIIGAFVTLLLIGGVTRYITDVKDRSYRSGFSQADKEWQARADASAAKANQLYINNTILQSQLREEQEKRQKALDALKAEWESKQIEYRTTPEAKEALGDGFINLYNKSLLGAN